MSVSHLELQESDKSSGFGVGAVARVYLNRFTVEASGYRASLDSDQPSLLPFTMIDGTLSVLYEVTPGVACLSRAISSETFLPGSCPPSPGLEPWAILISNSSA